MLGMHERHHGPLFDGRASRAVDAFLDEAKEEVGQEGVDMVRLELDRVLQNPTGYYWAHVQTERQRDDWSVNDDKVVYGPWLEGTGSRNRTTRFKGYATFRRTTSRLQAAADGIAHRVLRRYLGRMN